LPELRTYTVKQAREVKVSATSPLNAALIASRAFSNTKKPEDQVSIQSPIREYSLDVQEDTDAKER